MHQNFVLFCGGGGCILFEICEKRLFQKCMGWGGGVMITFLRKWRCKVDDAQARAMLEGPLIILNPNRPNCCPLPQGRNWIYDKYFFVSRSSKKKRFSRFIQGTNIFLLKFSDFKFLRYFFVKDILFSKLLYPRFMLRKNFVLGEKIFRLGNVPLSQKFLVCPLCFKLLRDKSLLTFFISNLLYESTSDILFLHQRCYLKIILFRFPKQCIKLRLFNF